MSGPQAAGVAAVEDLAREVAQLRQGPYALELVTEARRLDEVLSLRFEVFNRELGEGLESSEATGLDFDRFDPHCHHLAVRDRSTGAVVGTYRLQTAAMAAAGAGFYSAAEFALEELPERVRGRSVELGRACIAVAHRSRSVLFLLWQGLARYVERTGSRYLFGCCSLTSQDPREGLCAAETLRRRGFRHPELWLSVRPGLECPPSAADGIEDAPDFPLPKLFSTYLRYGARVVSPPAIDREFKTIDFLVILDVTALDSRSLDLFFGRA